MTTPDSTTTETLTAPEPTTAAEATTTLAPPASPDASWIKGPAPAPIVIGVLGLVAVAVCFLQFAPDLAVNWAIAGPAITIGVGALILVLGLIGLRRNHN